jgi:hypothetical protein
MCEKLSGQLLVYQGLAAIDRLARLRAAAMEPLPRLVWAGFTDQEREGDFRNIYDHTVTPDRSLQLRRKRLCHEIFDLRFLLLTKLFQKI